MLTPESASAQLAATGAAIAALARDIGAEQARWKPAPADWSITEVLCHLYDEEREDFRLRLDLTLHQPEAPLPPIDPEGWVAQRAYNSRSLPEVAALFAAERERSLAWLAALQQPDWERVCNHPQLVGLRAGDLLAAWVGHDLLHIRQLNELRWRFLAQAAEPYRLDYAGDW